jgi:hypothetical protein
MEHWDSNLPKNFSLRPPPPQPNSAHIFSLKGKHVTEGVTKKCRLSHSLLTNSALAYESQCGWMGGVAWSQSMSAAVHIT